MRSRFFTELRLRRDRRGVIAAGPLGWDRGEQRITLSILIYQHDGRIAGAGCSPPVFNREDNRWELEVLESSGGKFKAGPAIGLARTIVYGAKEEVVEWANPSLMLVRWDRPVE